jgi:hypothetical protein
LQPSSVGTPQRGVGKRWSWPNHGINHCAISVLISCGYCVLLRLLSSHLALLCLRLTKFCGLKFKFYRITYSPPSRCSQAHIKKTVRRRRRYVTMSSSSSSTTSASPATPSSEETLSDLAMVELQPIHTVEFGTSMIFLGHVLEM